MNVLLPLVLNTPELLVFSAGLAELLAWAANVAKLNWLTDEFDRFGTASVTDVSVAVTAPDDFWANEAKLRPVVPPNKVDVGLLASVVDVSSGVGVEVALNVTGVKGDDALTPFSVEILNAKLGVSFFCSPMDSVVVSLGFGAPNPLNTFVAGDDGVIVVVPNKGELNGLTGKGFPSLN